MTGELTNASTTQLLNAERGEWDEALFRDLGLPLDLMPALRPADERQRSGSTGVAADRPFVQATASPASRRPPPRAPAALIRA